MKQGLGFREEEEGKRRKRNGYRDEKRREGKGVFVHFHAILLI